MGANPQRPTTANRCETGRLGCGAVVRTGLAGHRRQNCRSECDRTFAAAGDFADVLWSMVPAGQTPVAGAENANEHGRKPLAPAAVHGEGLPAGVAGGPCHSHRKDLSSTRRRKGYQPMGLTRNHYFMAGVLLVLLGVQFRLVQSFVLNEPATRTLIKISKRAPGAASGEASLNEFLVQVAPNPKKRVEPPRWLGLAMVAVGAVLSLHALAMPRQG